MYVEISGRQTGKTTRLVDHASDELLHNINDRNYVMAVVSHSHQSGKRINRLIVQKTLDKISDMGYDVYGDLDDATERLNRKIIVQRDMEQPLGRHINKFYVDEFSFINDQNQRRGSPLRLDNDAYYCTTPKPGDEFTLYLKNYCEHNNIEIVAYDISQGLRNEFQMTAYVEEFDNWCVENQLWMMNHPFEESRRLNERGFIRFNKIKRHRF